MTLKIPFILLFLRINSSVFMMLLRQAIIYCNRPFGNFRDIYA